MLIQEDLNCIRTGRKEEVTWTFSVYLDEDSPRSPQVTQAGSEMANLEAAGYK